MVVATCGCGGACCCSISAFPWLWWGLSVVIVYLIGWIWYSKIFAHNWCECEQLKCKCGADLAKGEECTCKKGSFYPMIIQFLATAVVGFAFFLIAARSVWVAVIAAIGVLGWEKAVTLFRVSDRKRACKVIWIEVGYYCLALIVFIFVAACLKHCCGCGCGCGCK